MKEEVLICGAGPTGLVLALRLARAGIPIRIIDASAEPGTTSRALVVHARTLEFYRQMGLSDAFLQEGLKFDSLNLWVRGRHVAHVELGAIGKGLTPFPHMIVSPQDRHERFLIEHLARAGVQVERGCELLDFEPRPDHVRVRLKRAGGREETYETPYLAGCDGSHSRVREILGSGFPGGTYSRIFFVVDVEASGPAMNDELHVALDEADLLGIFPLRGGRTGRLIGTVRADQEKDREALRWEDIGQTVVQRMKITIERVNWFSTYRVHHRVATSFRRGRVFLLGDAAHVHSPVGAQGMNTGIGDAVNLSWKLADVIRGRAGPRILDSYEPERIAFARRLVSTTDRAFTFVSSTGPLARLVRVRVVPEVLPAIFRFRATRRFLFRTVSQTAIHYRESPLSAGRVGSLHGGDRLPWVRLGPPAQGEDNFAVLDGLEWQAHVYGKPAPGAAEACRTLRLPLHRFGWEPAMGKAGLTRDALFLVRPDGHVALADAGRDPSPLQRYVESLGRI
ncbi:MAG TPA: FAD-dependent monooxygenase [Candidatus Polarisedimenticolia bacterium]|nr:FAD-dependent monooxygenase [Candidatus Polarisedimenticolia bacterium]